MVINAIRNKLRGRYQNPLSRFYGREIGSTCVQRYSFARHGATDIRLNIISAEMNSKSANDNAPAPVLK